MNTCPTCGLDTAIIAEVQMRDAEIAALTAERDGLAAVLHANTKDDLIDLMERCECASLPVKCGCCIQREHLLSIEPNYAAILAARDTEQRRQGAIEALESLLIGGGHYAIADPIVKSEIRLRIAALKGEK